MRRSSIAAAAVAATLALPVAAHAAFAPPDSPGPPLSVPTQKLAAALECHGGVAQADRAPILLVPGTTLTPQVEYSWNWEPALTELGPAVAAPSRFRTTRWATSRSPASTSSTRSARCTPVRTGAIAVMGTARAAWCRAGRFGSGPDTRRDGRRRDRASPLQPRHGRRRPRLHGRMRAGLLAAARRTRISSRALNSGQETFPGISYTSVYTHTDEVVVPNLAARGLLASRRRRPDHQRRDPGRLPG